MTNQNQRTLDEINDESLQPVVLTKGNARAGESGRRSGYAMVMRRVRNVIAGESGRRSGYAMVMRGMRGKRSSERNTSGKKPIRCGQNRTY